MWVSAHSGWHCPPEAAGGTALRHVEGATFSSGWEACVSADSTIFQTRRKARPLQRQWSKGDQQTATAKCSLLIAQKAELCLVMRCKVVWLQERPCLRGGLVAICSDETLKRRKTNGRLSHQSGNHCSHFHGLFELPRPHFQGSRDTGVRPGPAFAVAGCSGCHEWGLSAATPRVWQTADWKSQLFPEKHVFPWKGVLAQWEIYTPNMPLAAGFGFSDWTTHNEVCKACP